MFKKLKNALSNNISCIEAIIMESGSVEESFEDIVLSEASKEIVEAEKSVDVAASVIDDTAIDVDDVESEDKIEDDVFGTVVFPDNKAEIEELVNKIPDEAPKQPKDIDDEIKKELDNDSSHEHIPTFDDLNDDDDEEECNEGTNLLNEIMRRI